jgi:DNA-binding Xre family transcriptional regulator
MNQQELADITGYDSAHLSRIINGKLKNLTYTTVIDIATALKTPPSKVFIYKPKK